jgi:short-subunit dehydrogenase
VSQQTNGREVAVITGASSGIGYELARRFVQGGFKVVIAAEDAGIHDVGRELREQGVEVDVVQVDLATAAGIDALYEQTLQHGGHITALVLNAGVGVGGAFLVTDLDEEIRMINLNCVSPVYLAKRMLPGMVSRRNGRVLITSSIAAEMPAPFQAVYGATKAFLLSFAHALRNELKDTGVTVTALQPGATDTNFFERAGMQDTKVGASDDKDDPADVAREAFDAMMAGSDHVVTGFKNKVQAAVAQVLPETAKAEMHRKLTEPGSAKSGKQDTSKR